MAAPLHGKHDASARGWKTILFTALTVVVIVGGGTVALVALHQSGRPAATGVTVPASSRGGTKSHHHSTPPPPPLRVESTAPTSGATGIAYAPTVTIRLSSALAPHSPLPVLSPSVPGRWRAAADSLVFTPSAHFSPYTTVHVTIPGGSGGLRDIQGVTLAETVQSTFTVAGASELRLQQLLAELGYLPLTFVRSASSATTASATTGVPPATATLTSAGTPAKAPSSSKGSASGKGTGSGSGSASTGSKGKQSKAKAPPKPAIDLEPTVADRVPLVPLAGQFQWRYPGMPSLLTSQWSPGTANVITRGAVMAFEAAAGLGVDGIAGPEVWQALLAAVAARKVDTAPYDYITVSESLPETLTVWQDGTALFHVPANTGIAVAPTEQGTYPVYARYTVTTMSGTNPDGSHYSDPGIPWVSYFNGGDAVHGFLRSQYGYPQSLGCVELSYADAEQVWPYDPLGTLVTVY